MVQTLRGWIEAGVSLREAGRRLGVSARTVYRRVQTMGDFARRRRRLLTKQDRRRIVRLAEGGEVSVRRLAAQVGVSWHAVERVLDRHRLPRLAPVHRCPTCGHTIQIRPCLVCRARASRQTEAPREAQTPERGSSPLRPPLAADQQTTPRTASAVRGMRA